MSGKAGNHANQRKEPRRPLQYAARILVDATTPAQTCRLADISRTGARLVLDANAELPDSFVLVLSRTGGARRRCRVVWRAGLTMGVEFTHS
jgi:hypothetical protein